MESCTVGPNVGGTAVRDNAQLSEDELQLRAQGHVGELPRQFSAVSILSFAFSITNSWIGYSAVFITPLSAGRGPGVIYCLLVASIACSFITAGLAELASAFPSSGGQYHFAYMVAPARSRAVIAFTTGWLSVFAWLFNNASACIFCAQICANIATIFHPQYVPTQWQVYLVYVTFVVACTLITIFLPKHIPVMETTFFVASVAGFVVFFVTVLAASGTKQSANTVFVNWVNLTGWNDGTAFLLGVGQAMYTFLSVDSASHIAEEVPQPGKKVPQTMWMTVLIGLVTVVPWTLAFMFSTHDLDAVSKSAVPIIEVYLQTMRGSKAGAAFFTTWLLFVYFGACIACTVTSGRLIWAFSRDRGLPFSNILCKVHSGLEVPVNATIFTGVFCTLYGLIYIGSTTAFNSIIATAILFLNVTYALPQAVVLLQGRKNVLPTRHFDLGAIFGPFCNVFSVLWVALFTVIFCFPVFRPVTAGSMNYVSVIIVGVCVFVALLWVCGKKNTFTGPDFVEMQGVELMRTGDRSLQSGTAANGGKELPISTKSGDN